MQRTSQKMKARPEWALGGPSRSAEVEGRCPRPPGEPPRPAQLPWKLTAAASLGRSQPARLSVCEAPSSRALQDAPHLLPTWTRKRPCESTLPVVGKGGTRTRKGNKQKTQHTSCRATLLSPCASEPGTLVFS